MGFRRGLTLVELLITILIIGILAAAVLGAAAVAGQSARESRTRIQVAKIHALLAEHVDSYKSRRVKVRPAVTRWINDPNRNVTHQQRNREHSLARLYAARELMLMEMPQRWSDVLLHNGGGPNADAWFPNYLDAPIARDAPPDGRVRARTPLANIYLRHYRRIASGTNAITGETNTHAEIEANQSAECLYLVVMNACGDGEARSLFPESMIGDTDGDGAKEFLDGWGRPIEFLRWAPGFNSDIQPNASLLGVRPTQVGQNPQWEAVSASDHDPLDAQRIELAAFRLVPLVYSTGGDGESGLVGAEEMFWPGIESSDGYAESFNGFARHLSPFLTSGEFVGAVADRAAAVDNIHNHLIRYRGR